MSSPITSPKASTLPANGEETIELVDEQQFLSPTDNKESSLIKPDFPRPSSIKKGRQSFDTNNLELSDIDDSFAAKEVC